MSSPQTTALPAKGFGLDKTDRQILRLARSGVPSIKWVATALERPYTTIHDRIEALVTSGLIELEKTKREAALSLTEKGSQALMASAGETA